jgi:hypothetical protein
MNYSDGYSEQPSQRPAVDPSPPVSSLGRDHTSKKMFSTQDPVVFMIAVVPPGFDSIRIYGDDPVHNFGTIFGRNENNHIPHSNFFQIARYDLQSIPSLEYGIHAGANVIQWL